VAVDDLPLPVVNFLNVIGMPWPYIDQDAVIAFGNSFVSSLEPSRTHTGTRPTRYPELPLHTRPH
jgi:hypothetical protein